MFRHKFIRDEVKVVSEAEATIDAVVSTESKDRDGDVIRAAGWQLDKFNAHPVLLDSHNYHSTRSQIGEWVSMGIVGKRLIGRAKYYVDAGNDAADWAWQLAQRGVAAFSVGFIPDFEKAKPLNTDEPSSPFSFTPMEFRGQELLEVSQVTVPSNPDALQRMLKSIDSQPEMVAEICMEASEMYGEIKSDDDQPEFDSKEVAEIVIKKLEERIHEMVKQEVARSVIEQPMPVPEINIGQIVKAAVLDGLVARNTSEVNSA